MARSHLEEVSRLLGQAQEWYYQAYEAWLRGTGTRTELDEAFDHRLRVQREWDRVCQEQIWRMAQW